ncbi:MAG: NTP transferase domain-containing protein [Polyangiaceae bacterium]|nr:NTP transferase domain-containing protein [Polyangiaceae bacterium]
MHASSVDRSLPYVAVVTAAGLGERMGGPKALLAVRWGDGTGELPLAIAHARAHLEGGADRVVVVTKAEVARMLARFSQRALDIVVSSAPHELGPAGSIRHALAMLPEDIDWLMIEPVDMPPSSAAIRQELLRGALRSPAPDAVRPVFEGRRGHPVLVKRSALARMLVNDPPTLREVLAALGDYDASKGGGALDVDVVDVRAVTGFDVPPDVQKFYGHEARFFEPEEPTFA